MRLLWDPPPSSTASWWFLVERAPHSSTPFDMLHTLGFAVAVVGAVLLLTRVQVVRRVLRPVADAGSMILTLYVGHLLVLATGVLDGHPSTQFACLLTALVTFAMIWRRFMDRGPLESLISAAAARLRGAVLDAHRPALPR